MTLSEQRLEGWLVFIRLNLPRDVEIYAPGEVWDALEARGWVNTSCQEHGGFGLTPEGRKASDLAAPEWGLDPVG